MKRMLSVVVLSFGPLIGACSDSTGPGGGCTPETAVLTPTVQLGTEVVFDWSPRCGVALVIVEDESTDEWVITTPEATWNSPSTANLIVPPLTYGQSPAGAATPIAPGTLETGHAYALILWRAVALGTPCQTRIENVCLVAVKQFVR